MSLPAYSLSQGDINVYLNQFGIESENLSSSSYESYEKQMDILENSKFELVKSKDLERINKQITQGKACVGRVAKWSKGYRDTFSFDREFREAMLNSKNIDSKCKKKILTEYLKVKYVQDDPRENVYCKRNDCNLINAVYADFEEGVADLVFDQYGSRKVKLYCEEKDQIIDNSDVEELISNISEINKCFELNTDESRVVNNSLNGVTQKYTVRRDSPKSYTASFNLNFFNSESSGDRQVTGAEKENMVDHVRNCVADNNKYLKDDRGNSLNLEILIPEETAELPRSVRPPQVNIGIDFENTRAHSKRYTSDIECSTVIHEILHLTGLYDEYEETAFGQYVHTETGHIVRRRLVGDEKPESPEEYNFTPDYNHCRAIAETPSVMASDRQAFLKVNPPTKTCRCQSDFPVSDRGYKPRDTYQDCRDHYGTVPAKNLEFSVNSTSSVIDSPLAIFSNVDYIKLCKLNGSKTTRHSLGSYDEVKNYSYYKSLRRVGSSLVVVKNSLRAEEGDFGVMWMFEQTCDCSTPENNKACEDLEQAINRVNREPHLAGTKFCPIFMVEADGEDLKHEPRNGTYIAVPPTENNNAILRNAHFERIISGDCESAATRYSECGKYSYVRLEDSCDERPDYCKDEALWLNSIQ